MGWAFGLLTVDGAIAVHRLGCLVEIKSETKSCLSFEWPLCTQAINFSVWLL